MNSCSKSHLSIYLLSLGLLIACGGKPGDRFGRRMAPSLFGENDESGGDATPEVPADAVLPGEDDIEYQNLLKACGGIDPESPDALILDQPLKAIPLRQNGTESIGGLPVRYEVEFDGDLIITSSINKNELNRNFNLLSATPQIASRRARERLAAQSGTLITDYVPYSERSALSEIDPVWSGVVCTVQPAIKTTNNVGRRVVVTYNKPLPIHISPIALRERYEQELSVTRRWEIEATVIESDHPDLPAGRVVSGFASIEPLPSQLEVTLLDGRKFTITGDIGVRIRIQFGSDAITNIMGLTPDSSYLVDNAKKRFQSITADIKDGMTPVINFVNPESLP